MQPDDPFATLPAPLTLTQTRLRGTSLWAVRVLWAILILGATGLFVAALPLRLDQLHSLCAAVPCLPDQISAQGVTALESIGLSLNAYAVFIITLEILIPVFFLSVSSLLFWRRSDDWMALFVPLVLYLYVVFGIPTTWPLLETSAAAAFALRIVRVLGQSGMLMLYFVFPNGRFVPRFSRWLLALYALLSLAVWFTTDSPISGAVLAVIGVGRLIGVIAQVYRYMRVSSQIERQQTKWAVLGFAIDSLKTVVLVVLVALVPKVNTEVYLLSSLDQLIVRLVGVTVLYVGAYQLPIMLSFAVMRSRLWDIDPILNRSMVYAGVTVVLGAAFAGAFFGLRALLEVVLGSGQAILAAVMSTLVVAFLFSPARKLLTRFVDRRLYGIHIDYHHVPHTQHVSVLAPASAAERQLGPYILHDLIGRGGMGEVYRASHTETGQEVAIKLLPTHLDDETMRRRFLREAQAMDRLDHPHIVALHEAGEAEGAPYMVMDFVSGQSLSEVMREHGHFSAPEAARILAEVAGALDYAHGMGIVHRDIKPSNVMLRQNGESHALLMDFGIAKLSAATALTLSGMMGTLDYIAPEQIRGASDVDSRADIYSMGVMAFQMLTGDLPFRAGNVAATVMAHLMQPPPDPRDLVPDLPRDAARAVMQAMSKEPDQRFDSAGAFASALR